MVEKKESSHAALRRRVGKVPKEPGVYRWLDAEGNVLYVGKAKNLKNRMQTYVQDGLKRSAWTEIMVSQIADFDVTVVRNELEAFILESNLIKELQPKYNIMLKDDKGYVYVRITVQDRYPVVEVVRRMEGDKAKYFGPFLGARDTHATLDMLDEILRFRACKKSINALNHPTESNTKILGTPCLDYQIGKCSGLCVGDVSEKEYRSRISEVEKFFRGHFDAVKKKAEELMKAAAADRKFEKAARIRDSLRFMDDLEKRQIVSDTSGDNIDVFGIALSHGSTGLTTGGKVQVVLLRQRDGKLIGQVGFALKGQADSAAEAMGQFLPQYYSETQDIPDVILVRDDIPEREVLEVWLKENRGKSVKILVPERGKKSKLLEMAEKNAAQKVDQQFAAWEAEAQKVEGALAELQQLLALTSPPRRIEGYDISHLGGTATVGSMVVMFGGKPKREHYRSFNMQTVKEGAIDDYKSLAETLRRRLKYLTQDMKREEERWKQEGIVFGKAKKAEQSGLETLHSAHAAMIADVAIDYRQYIVARHEKEIVGFGRLFKHPQGLLELKSIFVVDAWRGKRLGQTIARFLLKVIKKGKVYVTIVPALESYYSELGFRHVLQPPQVLIDEMKEEKRKFPETSDGMVMVYDTKDNRLDESFASIPDLLLIDGGKGQLSAAVGVLKEFNLAIPVAGLAKREEEIFVPDRSDPLTVPQDSQARFLLQRLRDEAHRFANDRRQRRLAATMTASKLDEVPGIGEATKAALLKKFGSADGVIATEDEALSEVLNSAQLKILREKFPRM